MCKKLCIVFIFIYGIGNSVPKVYAGESEILDTVEEADESQTIEETTDSTHITFNTTTGVITTKKSIEGQSKVFTQTIAEDILSANITKQAQTQEVIDILFSGQISEQFVNEHLEQLFNEAVEVKTGVVEVEDVDTTLLIYIIVSVTIVAVIKVVKKVINLGGHA